MYLFISAFIALVTYIVFISLESELFIQRFCQLTERHLAVEPIPEIRNTCSKIHFFIEPHLAVAKVKSLMQKQGISHFSLQDMNLRNQMSEPQTYDSGVRTSWIDGELVVTFVFNESAAGRAGVHVGDTILKINDEHPHVPLLAQQKAKWTVKRLGRDLEFFISPQYYEITEKDFIWRQGDTLHLRPPEFIDAHWSQKRLELLQKEIQSPLTQRVILDLRDHSGGKLGWGFSLLGLIKCGDAYLGKFETRLAKSEERIDLNDQLGADFDQHVIGLLLAKKDVSIHSTNKIKCYHGPLEVHFNSETASMAEIILMSLEKRPETQFIGKRSAGMATLGLSIPAFHFRRRIYFFLPFALFRSSSGQLYEGEGFFSR